MVFAEARREGRREEPGAYAFDALKRICTGTAERRAVRHKVIVRIDLDTLFRGYPTDSETCDVAGVPVAVSAVEDILSSAGTFLAAVVTTGERISGVAHLGRAVPLPPPPRDDGQLDAGRGTWEATLRAAGGRASPAARAAEGGWMMGVIFHLTTAGAWEAAATRGVYRPANLDADGFTHCSHLEQVERVARERYAGTNDLVVLAIDPTGLDVRDERGDLHSDELFPHLYGELPVEAVTAVLPFAVNEPERCDECDFDGATVWPDEAADYLDRLGDEWRSRLEAMSDEEVRRRPSEGVWSPLEYAAHSRDVTAMVGWAMREVLEGRALPGGADGEVDVDEVARQAAYNEQDPATVLAELTANAQRVARHARGAKPEDWFRSARVGGETKTALDALRHIVHDASHHVMDVDRWNTTQPDRR